MPPTTSVSAGSAAVANATRPAALFACLLTRLAERMPAKVGRDMVRLVDATSINLNRAVYDWARFSTTYAGVKLHLVYDPEADVPTYFTITSVKVGDGSSGKDLLLEADLADGGGFRPLVSLIGNARALDYQAPEVLLDSIIEDPIATA